MGLGLNVTDRAGKSKSIERRTKKMTVLIFMGFLDNKPIKNIACYMLLSKHMHPVQFMQLYSTALLEMPFPQD